MEILHSVGRVGMRDPVPFSGCYVTVIFIFGPIGARWRRTCSVNHMFSCILWPDRKSTRLNSSHLVISYAVFCLKKKKLAFLSSDNCPPSGLDAQPQLNSGTLTGLRILTLNVTLICTISIRPTCPVLHSVITDT